MNNRPSFFSCWQKATGLLGLLALCVFPAKSQAANPQRFTSGPFEIETVIKRISAGGFPNTSANPFARISVTNFTLKYKGKPVIVQSDGAKLDTFSDAWFLEGAPQPAVLLALSGVYLVTEAQGQLKTQVLSPGGSDIASQQWLDANNGQPATPHDVTIRDATGESHILTGGRLLLLNRNCVLDIGTLRSYRINLYDGASKLDDFNASNEPARALSPGKTQYLMVGDRRRNDQFEYALVAVDYANNKGYVVAFDMNSTRIESVWDVTPEWINHYFQWRKQADGSERLALNKGVKPLPWMGRVKNFGGGAIEYHLGPVQEKMLRTFLGFLQREFGAKPASAGNDADRAKVTIEDWPFNLWFHRESKDLSIYAEVSSSKSTAPAYAIIQRIATRFNSELAKGQYQSEFAGADRAQ